MSADTERCVDLGIGSKKTLSENYREQKALLDQPVPGRFIVGAYAEKGIFDRVELGSDITLRKAIEEAKYLYGDRELDNIAYVAPDGHEIPVNETLVRQTASQIVVEPRLESNKMILNEFRELASTMGADLTERILNPVMDSIMEADRNGQEYRKEANISQTVQPRQTIKRI